MSPLSHDSTLEKIALGEKWFR